MGKDFDKVYLDQIVKDFVFIYLFKNVMEDLLCIVYQMNKIIVSFVFRVFMIYVSYEGV